MNPINHFEIPYDDFEKAKEFYEKVFGWKFQEVGGAPYHMVYTCEVDDKFMCKEPNTINGGMYKRGEEGAKSPVVVITVPNLPEHLEKIKQAGGEIVFGPTKVGDMGYYAQVKDTQENIIGVWQNAKKE